MNKYITKSFNFFVIKAYTIRSCQNWRYQLLKATVDIEFSYTSMPLYMDLEVKQCCSKDDGVKSEMMVHLRLSDFAVTTVSLAIFIQAVRSDQF